MENRVPHWLWYTINQYFRFFLNFECIWSISPSPSSPIGMGARSRKTSRTLFSLLFSSISTSHKSFTDTTIPTLPKLQHWLLNSFYRFWDLELIGCMNWCMENFLLCCIVPVLVLRLFTEFAWFSLFLVHHYIFILGQTEIQVHHYMHVRCLI